MSCMIMGCLVSEHCEWGLIIIVHVHFDHAKSGVEHAGMIVEKEQNTGITDSWTMAMKGKK